MTYGLVLSAESIRYQHEVSEESKDRIKEATTWLINNDVDIDGRIPGQGISAAWDAFADDSESPADQPYTITAAIVIEGLLDVLQTSDVLVMI